MFNADSFYARVGTYTSPGPWHWERLLLGVWGSSLLWGRIDAVVVVAGGVSVCEL